ncbi:MAG: glucokinase [Pseudomonadota bacterium]|nr:glucokinase [Pseudomonadota bacterium]
MSDPSFSCNHLLGDIGGTHTRLTLYRDGRHDGVIGRYRNREFTDLPAIVRHHLQTLDLPAPQTAVLAVAGPLERDGAVTLTNRGWRLEPTALAAELRLASVDLVNDFTAQALGIPHLDPEECLALNSAEAWPHAPRAVLGPGTGLGVSGLLPTPNGWLALSGEGGHVTLPPADARESALLDALRVQWGHISAERVVSGPGLLALYNHLAVEAGTPGLSAPPEVTTRAGHDPLADEALGYFFAFLGTIAGNLALTLGARGGVYLCGGILPDLQRPLRASAFHERFCAKGRYRAYLEAVPIYLVTAPDTAFRGLISLLASRRL